MSSTVYKPRMHEYSVVGRRKPSDKEPHPKIYRMRIFAVNEVVAKSRFWYYISRLRKIKKSAGELLACQELHEKNPFKIKNYGVFLRYNSRTGTHNMHKEYRDLSRAGAIDQMYNEMASRHKARHTTIQIIEVNTLKPSQTRRANTKQFHDAKIKFPLPHRVQRPQLKKYRTTFAARRPHTHW
eukprot:TRINITY_DN3775_c0_g2_i1.p1 TRINITY_DN3775_c0_g2~~TRINITY_DN3775_c0_g2_i1.p1  ORF type:complete len:183 (-),score=27.48 TRINITY_DN3775_c0_g2_i1:215-763(-)